MATNFVGEIRLFAGNFAPAGWEICDGELLPISGNETLFQLIGTIYGGDGQSTFALPDLRGRVPIHRGTGVGLTQVTIGEQGGAEDVTLTTQQIPIHNHLVQTTGQPGTASVPSNTTILANEGPGGISTVFAYKGPEVANQTQHHANSVGGAGGSQPHSNLQPYLTINYIISLFGVFPQQN